MSVVMLSRASQRAVAVGPTWMRSVPAGSQIATKTSEVLLPKSRLEALQEAEIVHYARAKKPTFIALRQILALNEAEKLREFLLKELPIHWARRIFLVESMPQWKDNPHLRMIRQLYSNSFHKLRPIPQSDSQGFRKALSNIKKCNSNMLMHVVRGTRTLKANLKLDDEQVNDFLDDFLTARIGTDVLTSQYLAITKPTGPSSVINPECNPESVARRAAGNAIKLCNYHYGYYPPIDVFVVGHVRFPFIEQYLMYILFELLKNSLRAVAERFSREEVENHPVKVVICGDESTVVIRISDKGGGIPLDSMSKIWSYLYTTARPQEDDDDSDSDSDGVAPMAGFGCGLPLSRNYASYMGGRLELNTMPGSSTDAYLYLNRLGNATGCL